MTGRIPVRLNTIAAAFEEAVRASTLVRLCESSGSDHSPEELSDLSDLVNSFIESDNAFETDDHQESVKMKENDDDDGGGTDSEGYWRETKDTLKSLVVNNEDGNNEKLKILQHTSEFASNNVQDMSSKDFKSRLMSGFKVGSAFGSKC